LTGRRAALVALAVVAADQLSKAVVRSEVGRGEEVELVLGLALVNVRNTGVAFSLLSGGGTLLVVLPILALVALIAFLLTQGGRPLVWLPAGLLLGGAAGNLVDRVRDGAVTDFIDLPWWPAFNLADAAITVGVIVLVWVLERRPR
jgi:signal peptidase II